MTTRNFSVYEGDGLYNVMVTASHPKHARLTRTFVRGYLSSKAAENDIDPSRVHVTHSVVIVRSTYVQLKGPQILRQKLFGIFQK